MAVIRKLWSKSCFDRYLLGILIAIEFLMSFTFLGYIHLPPLSVTTAYIPILVAGCLLGPAQSVVIGLVFGSASMYKASATYVMPADAAFSPFLSGSPISSLLLSVGTRALFGLLIGIAFLLARKRKHFRLWAGVISMFAPKVHSLLVYTTMGVLFPELGYHYHSALHWAWDDSVFAAICVITVEVLWAIYQSKTIRHIKLCMDQSFQSPYSSRRMNLFFVMFEFFVLCMAVFAANYFSQRESFMLNQHGIAVSPSISADLMHLQIQFLFAMLSLNAISVILLMSIYKYMAYNEYMGDLDALTGVMGRRMFLYHCEKAQKTSRPDQKRTGWFLFVDADYFKTINDTFGHSVGDQVLQEIAVNLQRMAGDDGTVGRLGGDEFAVLIESSMPQDELKRRLDQFLQGISCALAGKRISCSIGAYEFVFPQNIKYLLEETDNILYKAKELGRACYVMQPYAPGGPDAHIKS